MRATHPVADDVVGVFGDEHPHVHPPPGGVSQRREHVLVGDEIPHGDPGAPARAVDRVEVEGSDGIVVERGGVDRGFDGFVPQVRPVVGEGGVLPAAEVVPHVGEGSLELPSGRPLDPHMGVPPVVGVQGADVVAADVPDLPVDREDLAMVASLVARSAGEDPRAHQRELEGVEVAHLRQVPEPRILVEVAPRVEDRVGLDSAARGVDEGVAELEAGLVGLDDEALEVDVVGRRAYVLEHRVVQVPPVGVDRHLVGSDDGLLRWQVREVPRLGGATFAHRVDGGDGCHGRRLNGERPERPPLDRADDVPPTRPAKSGHATTVASPGAVKENRRFVSLSPRQP